MCGRLEKKISTIESEYAVLGYIVTGYYLKNPQETVRSICLQKKPVAVVYEGLIRKEDIANFPHNAHAFFFDSGKPSGALVARHLLMLGHRSIAYIDYESADGSRPDRREEIVRVMTAAGGTVQVSSVTQIHNDKINACFSDAARTISKRLEGDHLRSPIDKTLARRIYEKLTRNAEGETFRVNLHAALDQLFTEKMFTAIVGGGVTSPVFILEYLNLKKIDVPREISLAGFGNSLAEAENDITSYDCDCFSVAHAIIWHLLRSTERKGTSTNRVTTIDGVLMTRLSTGKVP